MPQPYNSLGQILAAGGGAYAANLHRQILPLPIIISKLRMVYPRITDSEINTLSKLGSDMVNAGNSIEHLPKGSGPSPDIFPEISVPIDVVGQRKMYKVLVGVSDEDTGEITYIQVETDSPKDYDTIQDIAEETMNQRRAESPKFAEAFPDNESNQLTYRIIWAIAINGV